MPLSRTGMHIGRFDNTIVGHFLNEEFKYDIQERTFRKENELNEMLEKDDQEEVKERTRSL